jgi:hypothetical protein
MPRVCETGVIPTLGYVAMYACFFPDVLFEERGSRWAVCLSNTVCSKGAARSWPLATALSLAFARDDNKERVTTRKESIRTGKESIGTGFLPHTPGSLPFKEN